MIVPLGHVFLLAGIVFSMGLVCLVARRNLIMTLIGVEVMMNAAAIAFVAAALRWQLMEGQPLSSSSSRWLRPRSPWAGAGRQRISTNRLHRSGPLRHLEMVGSTALVSHSKGFRDTHSSPLMGKGETEVKSWSI